MVKSPLSLRGHRFYLLPKVKYEYKFFVKTQNLFLYTFFQETEMKFTALGQKIDRAMEVRDHSNWNALKILHADNWFYKYFKQIFSIFST